MFIINDLLFTSSNTLTSSGTLNISGSLHIPVKNVLITRFCT
jgi:hypothetical protein